MNEALLTGGGVIVADYDGEAGGVEYEGFQVSVHASYEELTFHAAAKATVGMSLKEFNVFREKLRRLLNDIEEQKIPF